MSFTTWITFVVAACIIGVSIVVAAAVIGGIIAALY